MRSKSAAAQEESLRQGEKLRALGQLTGGVAHDFNNIIQVIAAGTEVLKRPNLSEKNRSVILDSCVRASQNAKKLVERLLAFARQQPLRPEAFNCNECISNIADMLRRTLGFHISVQERFAERLTSSRSRFCSRGLSGFHAPARRLAPCFAPSAGHFSRPFPLRDTPLPSRRPHAAASRTRARFMFIAMATN